MRFCKRRKHYMKKWVIAFLVILATPLIPRITAAGIPTDQIKATVDRALLVLKDPQLKAAAKAGERRDQVKQILFARLDFTEMAKRSLGSNWRRLTPNEQTEFVRLFTDLLVHAYSETIESYTDEKIVYLGEKLDGNYAEVRSKIVTSKGQEFTIDYKSHRLGNEWRVYDIVIENVSMVNNFRSQFNRIISHDSYDGLIRRLKEKQTDVSSAKN
jgi:phospholipid transport system substrate-binding protein